jgi:exopolyphosphatase/pppGpp-phosphohydrolase
VPFDDWQHDDGVVIDIGGGNTVENTHAREKDMTP